MRAFSSACGIDGVGWARRADECRTETDHREASVHAREEDIARTRRTGMESRAPESPGARDRCEGYHGGTSIEDTKIGVIAGEGNVNRRS
jgi:hypothetical protein